LRTTRTPRSPSLTACRKSTPASQDARLKYWEDVLNKTRCHCSHGAFTRANRSNYDIYRPQIQVLIANQRFRDFEMPANSDTTFWTNLGYTARRPFRTLQDYQKLAGSVCMTCRATSTNKWMKMRAGLKRGFTPPKVTMEGRDSSITAVTEATPEASLFYTPFKDMPGNHCHRPGGAQKRRRSRPFVMSCSRCMSSC